MSLDAFIARFSGMTESYWFYNNTVELRYEPKEHIYYRMCGGDFIPQDGVTTAVHIIDKSDALIPWGCKMMAAKLLSTAPLMTLPTGERVLPSMSYADFEGLVLGSKNAHKEKLEEAASTGSKAHAWIEQYIKAVLKEDEERKHELLAKFPDDERAKNCCLAALDWMQKHNVRWISTERKVYSKAYEYAGTADGLCTCDSCGNHLCCPNNFKDRLTLADWKSSNYLYIEYLFQTAAYENAIEEEDGIEIEDRWVLRLGKDDGEFQPWHREADKFNNDFAGFESCLRLSRRVRKTKEDVKSIEKLIKDTKKAEADAIKAAANRIKCPKADTYKGVRPPKTCNGGEPCEACLKKYEDNHKKECLCLCHATPNAEWVYGRCSHEPQCKCKEDLTN